MGLALRPTWCKLHPNDCFSAIKTGSKGEGRNASTHPRSQPSRDKPPPTVLPRGRNPDTGAPMPDVKIFKVGQQSKADPFQFTMSSDSQDSYGDIVEQDWDLEQFHRNPIALYMHNPRWPIGTWASVGVREGRLVGGLSLAAPGTSVEIDTIRSLLEQRILRAVSVGFTPGEAVPINPKTPYEGFRLKRNKLLECSVVSIPANGDALARYIRYLPLDLRYALMPQSGSTPCASGACAQLEKARSQASDPTATFRPTSTRNPIMSLALKIKAKQDEINNTRDAIADLAEGIDDTGALSDDVVAQLDDLNGRLERSIGHLTTMEATEAAMGKSIGGAGSAQPKATDTKAADAPRIQMRSNKPKGYRAFSAVSAIVKGFGLRQDPAALAEAEYRDTPEVAALVRAATAPATTTGATWASALVQETWDEFIDLLRDTSIYPQVPGRRINVSEQVNLPVNNGRGGLAGGFIGENGAIPVKVGNIGSTNLIPKKLAVISSYTKELARRSMPSIQGIVRDQILRDTSETLDTLFLDAEARTATRPAGLQDTTETGAGNINAASNVATGAHGSTVAEILLDIDGVLSRAEAIKASGGVWLMNPAQMRGLRNKQDAATGEFVFRDSIDAGRFEGIPIVSSTNVTAGITVYVAADSMGFGQELSPYFEVSDSATLHFEDTSPMAIGTVGVPNEVAAPTYSLFQQDAFAIKMIWTMDWRILRQAGIQVLTGTTGW